MWPRTPLFISPLTLPFNHRIPPPLHHGHNYALGTYSPFSHRTAAFHIQPGGYWDDRHHQCHCRYGEDDRSENCQKGRNPTFDCKDIAIRGVAQPVRLSFLADQPKFEADIVKYMEKKSKEDVPDRVVDMLISFINREHYYNKNVLDEVTLCILASNLGVKSVVDNAVSNLQKMEDYIRTSKELCQIIACILLSSKVDAKLTGWLKKFLLQNQLFVEDMHRSTAEWHNLIEYHPELLREVQVMMDLLPERKNMVGYRQL
jgi:hypothetical protein